MCKLLGLSTSSYYEHIKGPQKRGSIKELESLIFEIFWHHKRRYGARRILEELKDLGHHIGRQRVRSVMLKFNLEAIQPKSFVPRTTQSDPRQRRSPNLLLDRPLPTQPNDVWVGDITYLAMKDGSWAYLSCWLDIFSHVIVGWMVLDHMREELVIDSLKRAIKSRRPSKGLIVHTDGGGQYGSSNFRKLLSRQKFEQSMTRRDNHYDNSFAESFFSRLKAEEIQGKKFSNLEEARSCCFEYIDMYYNTQRKHSSIGYKKPLQFEREREE